MTTAEVAAQFVALLREGKFVEAARALYADDIVSVKPVDDRGQGREMRGKKAVMVKSVACFPRMKCTRPPWRARLSAQRKFAVKYDFVWTREDPGKHVEFLEVAVYEVAGGKITREEFLYAE